MMNKENEREPRVEEVTVVDQEVSKVNKAEVRKALKRMKSGRQLVLMIYLWSYGNV